jgi:hypothetical protein
MQIRKRALPRNYKIQGLPIRLDHDNDLLFIERESYPLSEVKAYLFKYCESLLSRWRLKVLWNSKGEPRALYCWDSIIVEAIEKGIIPFDESNLSKEPSNRSTQFIFAGGKY